MTRELCQHGLPTDFPCPECEADSEAFRAKVRNGEIPCPICGERVRGLREALMVHHADSEDALLVEVSELLMIDADRATNQGHWHRPAYLRSLVGRLTEKHAAAVKALEATQ